VTRRNKRLTEEIASVFQAAGEVRAQHAPPSDHVGNNQKFIDAGAQVVGLEALKKYMTSDPRTKTFPDLRP
jgi:hypothetical protein